MFFKGIFLKAFRRESDVGFRDFTVWKNGTWKAVGMKF